MKVLVEATISCKKVFEIPDYVKRNDEAIKEYLVDNYYGFDCAAEGEDTFTFEGISICKNQGLTISAPSAILITEREVNTMTENRYTYWFLDHETGEEFFVELDRDDRFEAIGTAQEYFKSPQFIDMVSLEEAEAMGLDTY